MTRQQNRRVQFSGSHQALAIARSSASPYDSSNKFKPELEKFIVFARVAACNSQPSTGDVHVLSQTALNTIQSKRFHVKNSEHDVSNYIQFVSRVLYVHHSTLKTISSSFKDRMTLNCFMANNLFHMSNELQHGDDLNAAVNAAIIREVNLIDERISQYISKFLHDFWYNVSQALAAGNSLEMNEAKLSNKDKNAIKNAFRAFNVQLERSKRRQYKHQMAHEELRATLVTESIALILPQYEELHNRFVVLDFAKNPGKHIRLLPSELRVEIKTYFNPLVCKRRSTFSV